MLGLGLGLQLHGEKMAEMNVVKSEASGLGWSGQAEAVLAVEEE